MMQFVSRVVKSVSFYPLGGAYIGAVAVLTLFAAGKINLGIALLAETLVIALSMLFSLNHQIGIVHDLVNSQRTELVARVDQLMDVLRDAGLPVPDRVDEEHMNEAVKKQKAGEK